MGVQGYHDTSSGRSSTNYLQPPVRHQHHNLRYSSPALPPMQRTGSHFHPPVVASSFRLPVNSHGIVPPEVGVEAGTRHPGPVAPTGIRIYRSHQGALAPEATLRNRNVPNLRIFPPEVIFPVFFPLSMVLICLKYCLWYTSSHCLLEFFCNMNYNMCLILIYAGSCHTRFRSFRIL